jgi:hypothetical protein
MRAILEGDLLLGSKSRHDMPAVLPETSLRAMFRFADSIGPIKWSFVNCNCHYFRLPMSLISYVAKLKVVVALLRVWWNLC